MCFSPQWRAIFRHLNVQKWSKHAVFCTFWLANVLFATAACNFWFLLWAPTSAPAALTGLLFDWPDTRIIEKTQHFATSLTFGADVSSFFWLSRYCTFVDWLGDSTAELCICFSTVHIVGSFYLNFLRLYNSICTVQFLYTVPPTPLRLKSIGYSKPFSNMSFHCHSHDSLVAYTHTGVTYSVWICLYSYCIYKYSGQVSKNILAFVVSLFNLAVPISHSIDSQEAQEFLENPRPHGAVMDIRVALFAARKKIASAPELPWKE